MFWNKLVKVISKDIPRIITKDIPRIVTKDIPRIITKDIPRIVTKDIPALTKRETYAPEIKGLRNKVAFLDTDIAKSRKQFLQLKTDLAYARQTFQSLTENFSNLQGKNSAEKRFPHLQYENWDQTNTAVEKTLKDVESVVRDALGFITLDLTEALWAPSEAKKELAFLKKKVKSMDSLNINIKTANNEIKAAIKAFNQANIELKSDYADKPLDTIMELRNQESFKKASAEADLLTAKRMLAAGSSIEEIIFITNLNSNAINELSQIRT